MKLLKEVLKSIFIDIIKELFKVNKLLFAISTLITLTLASLVFFNPLFYICIVSYPIIFLILLMAHNFTHTVIIKCLGIREGQTPEITNPNFSFVNVVGARKIDLIYNSRTEISIIKNMIDTKLKNIQKYDDVYYFGLISVPLNAAIGYKVGQRSRVHIYNFDRTKSEWIMISNFDNSARLEVKKINKANGESVNVVLPFSYKIDLSKISKNYPTYILDLKTDSIDIDVSYASIMKQVTDIIVGFKNVYFYAAINNGLAFYMGMRLNDSNMPNSFFFEYGGSKNPEYIFSLNIRTLEKLISTN